jgi:hypothetical protein
VQCGCKFNDDVGHYIPIIFLRLTLPILFNMVAYMLAVLIYHTIFNGQIEGVVLHLVDVGLSIFQYDIILFIDHDTKKKQ